MRKKQWLFVVLSIGLLAWSVPARAKVLELWLQAQGGGMFGIYGTEKYDPASQVSPAQDDFFRSHSGAAFGAQAGIELFFVDVILDFAQFADNNGLSGTLTCFMLGFDWDFPLSKRWEVTPFGNVGFALATFDNGWLQKEYPQIAKADLTARGVVARFGARLEFKLHEMFRLGIEAGGGYHYMLQTDKAANDLEGHSHGFHAYAMGIVRFQWEPFRHKERKHKEPAILVVPPAGAASSSGTTTSPGSGSAPGTSSAPSTTSTPAPTRPAAARPDSDKPAGGMAPAGSTGDASPQGSGGAGAGASQPTGGQSAQTSRPGR